MSRCAWCTSSPLYMKYHDEEWGKLTMNETKLFEFLVLESAQAGLSWITILKRREGYRKAFLNYDLNKIANFTEKDIDSLMENSEIIRNRMKIEAVINNASRFMEVQYEFGSFFKYSGTFFEDGKPLINKIENINQIPTKSEISDKMSKDMKKRGFKFFGSTLCYSYLQSIGYINDHVDDCEFKY